MAVSDHDLETLEIWLDGELPASAADELRRRLSTEPALAQAVDRLRADRQMRSHLWQVSEPGESEVDGLVNRVRQGVRQDQVWTLRFRALRAVSGIAASIVVVFMVGWIARDRLKIGPTQRPNAAQPAVVATTSQPPVAPSANIAGPLADPKNNALVDLVGAGQPPGGPANRNGFTLIPSMRYRVQILDESGNVYTQQVDGLDQLRKVPDDFVRAVLQQGQPANQPGQGR